MNEQDVLRLMEEVGAVIADSHIVYTSGKHGTGYINKDAIYPHTQKTSELCRAIAEQFVDKDVQVVVAPALGGIILSQWVAYHLSILSGQEVLGIYAEQVRKEQILVKPHNNSKPVHLELPFGGMDDGPTRLALLKGQEIVVRYAETSFVIKRGYDKLLPEANVLVVEDVLTTGGSARKVVEVTRAMGGNVIGLGVLCNHGGITPQDVANVPELFALVNIKLDTYDEVDCPLCAKGVPINTDVGKGKEYLASKNT